jgi:pseudaminic acid cytidylyltransferase
MRVAVIPARGGSKRIPRKNIRTFCGRPMIGWPIGAAKASGCFDRIIVSTDDPEIADVGRGFGAEAPFLRPPELADDFAPTVAVIAHAVRWLDANGASPDAVCCIYPTAPLLEPDDLKAALALLMQDGTDYVFPVTPFPAPIARALRLSGAGNRVSMFQPEHLMTRSQDLEPAYHDAGQFYWGRAEAWREERPVYGPGTAALIIPRTRVQDIDMPEDWEMAEAMVRALRGTRDDRG